MAFLLFTRPCGREGRGASPHTRPRGDQQQFPLGSPLPPLAKLHALDTSFVLIQKSLTLPMGRPFPPKATQTSCLRHAIFFNALQQLRTGRWTSEASMLTVNPRDLCLSHFSLVSFREATYQLFSILILAWSAQLFDLSHDINDG